MHFATIDYGELFEGVGQAFAWGALAVVLLAIGYFVIDLLTPGKLGDLIYLERNTNAAVVVASGVIAIGGVITTAIVTSDDGFADGLVSAGLYGLAGIVLVAVAFVILDWLTPGDLRVIVTQHDFNPAVWVVAANHLALGAILAAAIS